MNVVLLSGGLDSAVNLSVAAKEGSAALALTIRYGQRAEEAELSAARKLADYYGVEWKSIDLSWLGEVNPTSLTRANTKLPRLESNELDNPALTQASAKAVWVANRNGVFLNVAAAFAEALGISNVLAGFNKEEAATFPDNSKEFMRALDASFALSTLTKVKVDSHTKDLDKTEIVALALELNTPLHLVWSCYEPGPKRCWKCESCKRTERALLEAGSPGREWLARMDYELLS